MSAVEEYPVNPVRADLGAIAPICTPYIVYFEPTQFCNLRCYFCSNKEIAMDLKTSMLNNIFVKFISDLSDFEDNIRVLSINGNGEPMAHNLLPHFISMAKKSNKIDKIRLITNGTLLTSELNSELISAGTDMIWISVEAMSSEKYKQIADVEIDFKKFVDNIRDLYEKRDRCKIYIKIVNVGLENELDRALFFHTFENICDNIMVENITNIYGGFKSISDKTKILNRFSNQEVEYFDLCDYLFKGISLNADGTCSPCPVDWKHDLVLGDITKNSLFEIWNSEHLKQLRLQFLEGNIKNIPTCKDCYLYLNAQSSIADIKSLCAHRSEVKKRVTFQGAILCH